MTLSNGFVKYGENPKPGDKPTIKGNIEEDLIWPSNEEKARGAQVRNERLGDLTGARDFDRWRNLTAPKGRSNSLVPGQNPQGSNLS